MDNKSMALLWYAVGAYRKLKDIDRQKIQKIADAASDLSQQYPLHVLHKPEFSLPHIGDEGITGLRVISYLAVAVDILSGFQITDRQMGGFSEWLIPARKLAEKEVIKIGQRKVKGASGQKLS